MNLSPDQQPIALREEFQKVWRRKYMIAGVVLVASVLAIILTMPSIWKPQYNSSAAFLPPNTSKLQSSSPVMIRHDGPGAAYERGLDRFAGLLTSDTTKFWMRDKFDLLTVYNIDAGDKDKAAEQFLKAYETNVSVQVSRWALVEIEVHDQDPIRARDMTQALLDYASDAAEEIARRELGLKVLKQQLDSIDRQLTSTQAELAELRRKYGTYDLKELPEAAANRIGGQLMSPDFHANYDRMLYLQNVVENTAEMKAELILQLQWIEVYLNSRPSLISVVSPPVVNYEVVRPKRMIIVVLAFLGTLLIGIFSVLLFDKKQQATTA